MCEKAAVTTSVLTAALKVPGRRAISLETAIGAGAKPLEGAVMRDGLKVAAGAVNAVLEQPSREITVHEAVMQSQGRSAGAPLSGRAVEVVLWSVPNGKH